MFRLLTVAATLGLALATQISLGKEELSLESYGGGHDFSGGFGGGFGGDLGGGHAELNLGGGGHAQLSLGGGGGGSYSGPSSYAVGNQGGSSGKSSGGDYHHGVSIIGTSGGNEQGASFDLTNHGSHGHTGSFGGTFIGSGKYEGAAAGIAHQIGGGGGHGGYATVEHGEYSDVLRASQGGGGGSSLGGGQKWDFSGSSSSSGGDWASHF